MILTGADFTGLFLIPDGSKDIILTDLIKYCQDKYLKSLLGNSLYLQLIKGLEDEVPADYWTDLVDGCDYTRFSEFPFDTETEEIRFYGIKEMLKYFTWCEYCIKTQNKIAKTGLSGQQFENATALINADFTNEIRHFYNNGVSIYNDAISFIEFANEDTKVESISGKIIEVLILKYVSAGSEINIKGNNYTVDSAIDPGYETTPIITVTENISPTDNLFKQLIFKNFKPTLLSYYGL